MEAAVLQINFTDKAEYVVTVLTTHPGRDSIAYIGLA